MYKEIKVGDSGTVKGIKCSVVSVEGKNVKVRFSSKKVGISTLYDWVTREEFIKDNGEKWVTTDKFHTENTENAVEHPAHYNTGKIEVIDYIEDKEMNFNIGNCCKYISRYKHKGNPLQDLEKARWYLDREIEGIKEEIDTGKKD